jgi:hypothetical protein
VVDEAALPNRGVESDQVAIQEESRLMGYGEWIKLGDGTTVHVYYGGKRPDKPKKCAFCERPSTRLCDFIVSPPQQVTHKRTCDAPMCDEHAQRVGPNKDYCPRHATQKELFAAAGGK